MKINLINTLLIVLLSNLSLLAQITPTNEAPYDDPNYLIQTFLGTATCDFSNFTYNGYPDAFGYFTEGASLGMSEGIVLSTGLIADIAGPNDDENSSHSFYTSGDMDLNSLVYDPLDVVPLTTSDAAVIEFDFVPTENTINFNYVFASEEYPEFVCGDFSDAIGFFLSGPGIVGGTQNLAVVPGTEQVFSINTVNAGSSGSNYEDADCESLDYSSFYIDNTDGLMIQFDGYTTPLNAQATVIPCETYHLKIAIADVGDASLDSAVFLEANGFNTGGTTDNTSFVNLSVASNDTIGETCGENYFLFERVSSDTNNALTVNFTIDGTATNGVDYNTIVTSITIPSGEASAQLLISTIPDVIEEDYETVQITLLNSYCNCSAPPSASITIANNCEGGIALEATVLLAGALNTSSSMNTNLLSNNLLPSNQPYNVAPWNYNGTESVQEVNNINPLVTDWVLVELLEANSNTLIERKAAFLLANGEIVNANGNGEHLTLFEVVNDEEYYIIIRHRNHLDIVSSQSISIENDKMTYDFTAAVSQAQGNEQMIWVGGSSAAMYPGDINGNGIITYQDFNQYLSQLDESNTYTNADLNLDGNLSGIDFSYYFQNSNLIGVDLIRY